MSVVRLPVILICGARADYTAVDFWRQDSQPSANGAGFSPYRPFLFQGSLSERSLV